MRARLRRLRKRIRNYYRRTRRLAEAERKARKGLATLRARLKRLRATPQTVALRWALDKVGTTESPPGSNTGPGITRWQKAFGDWLVGQPWCGVFAGIALRQAGVKGIGWRVASVAHIEDDAKTGQNGFRSWHGEGKRGDVVVLFGRGVHVELVRRKVPGGYLTVGGNTSSGDSGSQSNGGGVFKRFRPSGVVRGFARPNY